METRDTPEMQNITLQEINDQQARRMFPVISFLAVAMVVGVIGNSLVFCVYCTRFRRTPTNLLILMLSLFDGLTAATQIPFEIVDLLYPYMYGDAMLVPCKIFRFTGSVFVCGSALTICGIAFERYKKISDPLNPLGMRKTRYLMVAMVTYVTVISVPMIFMYGYHTEDLTSYGVAFNGSDCAVDDKVENTSFPGIVGGFLLLNLVVCFSAYGYFYIRIAVIVWQRKKKMSGVKVSNSNEGVSQNGERLSLELSETSPPQKDTPTLNSRMSVQELRVVSGVKIRTAKLTVMFLVISIVCAISFLPVLAFDVINSLVHLDEVRKQNAALDVTLEFCQKTFCINTCSNPIIYSIMNPPFRKACVDLFKRGCGRRRMFRERSKIFSVTGGGSTRR